MLVQMADRGPDSAGVAVYRDPAPDGWSKLTLYSPDPADDWDAVCAELGAAFGGGRARGVRAEPRRARRRRRRRRGGGLDPQPSDPTLRVMSAGRVIEIYKEVGRPQRRSPQQFALADFAGHARRSATRAWRPRAASRRRARTRSRPGTTSASSTTARSRTTTGCASGSGARGSSFQTENDTEVAAGYLAWRLREGASLEQALEGCLDDLDGFYTFLVGTADGFAVLRDPIACKPAVLAETDDWVAMASEWRAIAVLPGAADARIVGAGAGGRLRVGDGGGLMAVEVEPAEQP